MTDNTEVIQTNKSKDSSEKQCTLSSLIILFLLSIGIIILIYLSRGFKVTEFGFSHTGDTMQITTSYLWGIIKSETTYKHDGKHWLQKNKKEWIPVEGFIRN